MEIISVTVASPWGTAACRVPRWRYHEGPWHRYGNAMARSTTLAMALPWRARRQVYME